MSRTQKEIMDEITRLNQAMPHQRAAQRRKTMARVQELYDELDALENDDPSPSAPPSRTPAEIRSEIDRLNQEALSQSSAQRRETLAQVQALYDELDALESGDPSPPPTQRVDTGGGAYVGGRVDTGGGSFVGRDQTVRGDVVHGDKAQRDMYKAGRDINQSTHNTTVGERGVYVGGDADGPIVTGNGVHIGRLIQQVGTLTSGPDGKTPLSEDELRTEVGRYLKWVLTQNRSVTLRGVHYRGQNLITLDLETVYVPLAATVRPDPDRDRRRMQMPTGRAEMEALEADRQTEIALNQVLNQGRRLIVTGGPGSGKTTVLMHIAWVLAGALIRDDAALAGEKLGLESDDLPLPIFVPVNRYANHRRNKAITDPHERTLAAFISSYLIERQSSLSLPRDFFRRLMRSGRHVILLLDGLDEVPNEQERIEVAQAIDDLVAGHPDLRVVVTCRSAAYKDRVALTQEFREIQVQPLAGDHIAAMIEQAYRAVEPHAADEARALADDLLAGIERMEQERQKRLGDRAERLVNSPLLVRMLLLVHLSERSLPQQRAELYQKAIENMIEPSYVRDAQVVQEIGQAIGNPVQHRELMQYVAFEMHQQGETQGREIEEPALRRLLAKREKFEPLTKALIATTRQRGTLMEERLGTYRFIHLAFQEFLVARHMVEALLFEQRLDAFVRRTDCLTDSWWREPLLLLAGYLSFTFTVQAEKYIRYLAGLNNVGMKDRPLVAQWAGAELAGTAVLEWPDAPDELRRAVAQQLADLISGPDPGADLPHTLRAQTGRVLSQLGDPRPGVGVDADGRPDIVWGKTVPAGNYMIGGDADARRSFDEQQVTIDTPYQLARYPVTYAQFQAFVEADDYDDARWWRGIPPKYQANVDQEPRWPLSNHPRVDVRWYEATAFCRWLSDRLGYEVRLPHEHEWEVAVRYNDGRKYPWGDEFVAEKANTKESGIGQTTAVGLYSGGRQPELDLYDMSGNVWEWCLNKYHEPEAAGVDDSGDARVVRGGSWYSIRYSARAAARGDDSPNFRNFDRGFRVLRRSPSHVH